MSLPEALLGLQQLTERLRRECPWDREQTAETIVPHTVEEAYEVADAALAGDPAKLQDELGDLLYQVFFLSLLLDERGNGDLESVARGIHAKLVRRHPHVFGDVEAETAGRVRENWERIKIGEEQGLFGGLAASLPALLYARKVGVRAAGVGFEFPDVDSVLAYVDDEVRELKETLDEGGERAFDELGDVLFAVVNLARKLGVDPELALRATATRFIRRVEHAAQLATGEGREFVSLPVDEQERYFQLAKEAEA